VSITPSNTGIKKNFFGISNKKGLFIISLIAAIIIENSIILYAPIASKIIYTNLILLINASVAAGLSVILVINIVLKQKFLNFDSKTHIALAIGLVLWLCANIQWVLYELKEVVPGVPSTADFFWLSAYPFLGYSLYSTFKRFYKKNYNKKVFLISLICSILFIISIIIITVSIAVFSTAKGMILFSIIIAYPILNIILIIPAIVMVIGFKKEPEFSIPRMCESVSLINLVIADSWFAIIFLSNTIEAIWFSNLLIVDHYLIISAGLLWSLFFLHPIRYKYRLGWKKNWQNFYNNKILKRTSILMAILGGILTTISLVVLPQTDFFSYSSSANNYLTQDSNEIKIGALLGLTGVSSERGITQKFALEEAVRDVNDTFSKSKIDKKIILHIEDTERNPNVAVDKLKNLISKGIRIIIGPSTSSELNATMKYIEENNIDVLLISQSSTSPSLAKKDNIFRFVQNDTSQGKEIAKKMWDDGIRLVVPIWRDDTYGNELYNAMNISFNKLGGKVSEEGIKYDPHIGSFAASLHRINFIMWDQELKSLSTAVSNAKKNFPPDSNSKKIGVYIISYGEIVPILIQASSHKDLDTVRWYGSDGIAKNEKLLEHQESVEFVHKTKFVTPLMSVDHKNEQYTSLEHDTGRKLNSYDANVYDALWIAALTEKISDCITIEKLKENFNKITISFSGASGDIKFDDNGDRFGAYDHWTVIQNQIKDYQWTLIDYNK
jgi:ABC-type branched-subunit amino acid transport system substrate-binding protein